MFSRKVTQVCVFMLRQLSLKWLSLQNDTRCCFSCALIRVYLVWFLFSLLWPRPEKIFHHNSFHPSGLPVVCPRPQLSVLLRAQPLYEVALILNPAVSGASWCEGGVERTGWTYGTMPQDANERYLIAASWRAAGRAGRKWSFKSSHWRLQREDLSAGEFTLG